MNWAYIAGFFDGEGHAGIPFGVGNTIHVGMTQAGEIGLLTLGEIREFLEQGGVRSRVEKHREHDGRKDVYRLLIRPLDARRFMLAVLPYLRVKRTLVHDLLRFSKVYPSLNTSTLAKPHRVAHMQQINEARKKALTMVPLSCIP